MVFVDSRLKKKALFGENPCFFFDARIIWGAYDLNAPTDKGVSYEKIDPIQKPFPDFTGYPSGEDVVPTCCDDQHEHHLPFMVWDDYQLPALSFR